EISWVLPLSQPDSLLVESAALMPASDSMSADGSISVSVGGGPPPYDARWSNGHSGLGISGLPPGPYSLTLTDANGCWLTAMYVLGVTSGTDDPLLPQAQVLPNPAADALSIRLPGLFPAPAGGGGERSPRFVLSEALGRPVREVPLTGVETRVEVSALPSGLYFWRLIVRGEVVQAGRVVKM
ncbi:MAG TPA: SprB repeat-containing protein, partial [Saprospiraceae bacterium]|nr:SprB repeat-containing protein [Saprospiraceae bacterium]